MIDNPQKRSITLTKNFNIPTTCYFSERECRAKPSEEGTIFTGAPVFFGFDMAYTRSPENDLACLPLFIKDVITEQEYHKDFNFLPKW